ncbi:MAG: PhnA domain-containing protein [Neomegalonema sp.]|nr:PhnA domain-containing protein [Neomegalonema sp.]
MSVEQDVRARAQDLCALCGGAQGLSVVVPAPEPEAPEADQAVLLCETCAGQVSGAADLDPHHLLCLHESAWSQVPAVQVTAWRLLGKLAAQADGGGWAQDLREQLYLEPEVLAWAQAETVEEATSDAQHRDSNGAVLVSGDTVTLIKDLPVKGAGFTAKRGTAVRNISPVPDNPEQISGRVNDQQIIILTKFVKKSG